jgi:hypothetical protein
MVWQAVIPAAASLFGGYLAGQGAKDAGQTQAQAAREAQAAADARYAQTRGDVQPWVGGGQVGLNALLTGMGLQPPGGGYYGGPQALPKPTRDQFTTRQPTPLTSLFPGFRGFGGYRPPGAQETTTFDEEAYNKAMAEYEASLAAAEGYAPPEGQFGALTERYGPEDFFEDPGYQYALGEGLDAIRKNARRLYGSIQPETLADLGQHAVGAANQMYGEREGTFYNRQDQDYSKLFGISEAGRGGALQLGGTGLGYAGLANQNITGAGNALAAGRVGASNAMLQGAGGAVNAALQYNALQQQQATTYGLNAIGSQPGLSMTPGGQMYDPRFQPGGGTGLRF